MFALKAAVSGNTRGTTASTASLPSQQRGSENYFPIRNYSLICRIKVFKNRLKDQGNTSQATGKRFFKYQIKGRVYYKNICLVPSEKKKIEPVYFFQKQLIQIKSIQQLRHALELSPLPPETFCFMILLSFPVFKLLPQNNQALSSKTGNIS